MRSSCTICTDLLTCENLAACPCGHVYHNNCLETWNKRSRTCPTCRKPCPTNIKLFFTDSLESSSNEDIHAVSLQNELRKQTALNLEKDAEIKRFKNDIKEKTSTIEHQKCRVLQLQTLVEDNRIIQESYKKQVEFLTDKAKLVKNLEMKITSLKANLGTLERFEKIIHGTRDEVDKMLKNIGNGPKTVNELSSQLIILKKENDKMRETKKNASREKAQLERDCNALNHRLRTKELECGKQEREIEKLQEQLRAAEEEKLNLKKKVDKMQQSFDTSSPRGTLINRLLKESPAPLKLDETIVLSSDTDDNFEIIDGDPEKKRSNKPKPDFVSPIHPGALQRNRKRSYVNIENSGRLSSGYNGLGGHSTVLMPSQAKKVKKVAKPRTLSKFVKTSDDPPPLPRM